MTLGIGVGVDVTETLNMNTQYRQGELQPPKCF